MGILSLIGKLAPTVGSIVGQLLAPTANTEGQTAVVRYIFPAMTDMAGVKPGLEADFRVENGKYILHNRSEDQNGVLSVEVPRRGNVGYQTLAIKSYGKVDVTPLFTDCAKNDVDTFGLVASTLEKNVTMELNGATTSCVTLSASGFKIPADGRLHGIGSYLDVVIDKNKITLSTQDKLSLPIINVTSLLARGSGDAKAHVLNFDGKGSVSIEIPVAASFDEKDSVDVEVICKFGEAEKILTDSEKRANITTMSDEDKKILDSAFVVNR